MTTTADRRRPGAAAAPETPAAAGAATTSAPDSFPASRLQPEAARARTEELFRAHGRLVAGLCRGLLRNAHEAEDAAQQAFLSVHAAFVRGAEPDDPARWLAAIARNECLARIRDRMRQPLPVADAGEAASSADPVAEATRRADLRALWGAVGALAPQQREALLLREFGGLSYDELALALGVSVPAVESLLFRARARLRVELRTAASALAGLLPRLLAGGGAAKVAGATVAAGLLTTGVVAGEHALDAAHAHRFRSAATPAFVNPLSDLPAGRAPVHATRRTSAARPPRRHASPRIVAPAAVAPPAPTPVAATRPGPPATPSGDASGDSQAAPADGGDSQATVPMTEDASATTLTTEDAPSDGETTTPAATQDGPGDTTTTTADTGGDGGSGSDGVTTDGGS